MQSIFKILYTINLDHWNIRQSITTPVLSVSCEVIYLCHWNLAWNGWLFSCTCICVVFVSIVMVDCVLWKLIQGNKWERRLRSITPPYNRSLCFLRCTLLQIVWSHRLHLKRWKQEPNTSPYQVTVALKCLNTWEYFECWQQEHLKSVTFHS